MFRRKALQFLFLLACFCHLLTAEEKVLVITHAFNKPKLIQWQHASVEKFMKQSFEYVVFNDASDHDLYREIHAICASLEVQCIDVPQEIHRPDSPYLPGKRNPKGDPSAECADTIQYMLDTVGFDYPGIVCLLDSDMFLIRDFHPKALLEDYAIACHPQIRYGQSGKQIWYFLPNLLIFDMAKLPDKKSLNFNLGCIDGTNVDTGGYTHFYLEKNPGLAWLRINCYSGPYSRDIDQASLEAVEHFSRFSRMFRLITQVKHDYEFYMNYTFMHFRAGSNWYQATEQARISKIVRFFSALNEVLGEPFRPPFKIE